MHLTNKYAQWYSALVQKRKDIPLSKKDGYCENHHIIPECLGGRNTKENMVMFSAREHYIAHLLLTKMYEGDAKKRMHYAFYSMRRKKAGMERYEPNSHIYEILVKRINRTPSEETRRRMSIAQKNRPPMSEEHLENLRRAITASYTPELKALRSKIFSKRIVTDEQRASMSKDRKGRVMSEAFNEKCRQRRGEKNARSKVWTISSPSGEIFTTKAMHDFCEGRGLSYSAFRNRSRENNRRPLEKGSAKGWSVLSCI
jgi:CRP-like cAMP-binding protein